MKGRDDRLTLWGLLLSLGLHAAVFVGVALSPDRHGASARHSRITLVEVDVEQQPPPEPEPTRVDEPTRPRAPRTDRKRVTPSEPGPTTPTLASDRPAADAPTADPLRPPPIARPSLVPGGAFALSLDAGVFEEDVEPGGLRAPTVSKDLVGDLTRETIGRGKVDRGLVHPYYVQLGKALIKHWDADRAVSKKGLAGFGEQFVQNSKVFNEIWLDKAAQFGATGAPIDAPVSNDNASRRTATVTNNIQGIGGVDLEARKEVSRQMREQFKATRRATIRVTDSFLGFAIEPQEWRDLLHGCSP